MKGVWPVKAILKEWLRKFRILKTSDSPASKEINGDMEEKIDLTKELRKNGWEGDWSGFGGGRKGAWVWYFDTSYWMIVEHDRNPRVYDVPYPDQRLMGWTIGLVEHLCKMEDERFRLRDALADIASGKLSAEECAERARRELKICYHTWLWDPQTDEEKIWRCPICGGVKEYDE